MEVNCREKIHSLFRTYVREKMYLNETHKWKRDLFFSHVAIFEKNFRIDEYDYDVEFVATCVTLMPSDSVPSGKKYSVRKQIDKRRIFIIH